MAEQHLHRHGLVTIEKNFTIKGGEIDLIMQDNKTIVFIEVRYRASKQYGHAASTVTQAKANKIFATANFWLMKQGLSAYNCDLRFDLVAIHQHGEQIEWFKNALTQG